MMPRPVPNKGKAAGRGTGLNVASNVSGIFFAFQITVILCCISAVIHFQRQSQNDDVTLIAGKYLSAVPIFRNLRSQSVQSLAEHLILSKKQYLCLTQEHWKS